MCAGGERFVGVQQEGVEKTGSVTGDLYHMGTTSMDDPPAEFWFDEQSVDYQ